jgi:hypothetical protein
MWFTTGNSMTSDAVSIGLGTVEILQNHYDVTGDSVTKEYRTAVDLTTLLAASWVSYISAFESLGWIQIRLSV